MIQIGCCAGIFGGLVVLLIGLLMPQVKCQNCGYKLPRFRSPKSFKQAAMGGWICPNCGTELDRKGNVIGGPSAASTAPGLILQAQADQTPKKVCPRCAEKIQLDARVCIHCGQEFTEADIEAAKQQVAADAEAAKLAAQEKASQAQQDAKEKSHRTWNMIFAISGGLLAAAGGLLTIAFIFYSFSKEAAEAAQTGGAMAIISPFICSVPILGIGIGLFLLGTRRSRTSTAESDAQNLSS